MTTNPRSNFFSGSNLLAPNKYVIKLAIKFVIYLKQLMMLNQKYQMCELQIIKSWRQKTLFEGKNPNIH